MLNRDSRDEAVCIVLFFSSPRVPANSSTTPGFCQRLSSSTGAVRSLTSSVKSSLCLYGRREGYSLIFTTLHFSQPVTNLNVLPQGRHLNRCCYNQTQVKYSLKWPSLVWWFNPTSMISAGLSGRKEDSTCLHELWVECKSSALLN